MVDSTSTTSSAWCHDAIDPTVIYCIFFSSVHHLQQFKDDSALFYHFSICPPSSETSSLLHGSIDSTSSGRGSLEVPSSRIKSTFSLNSLLSSGSSLSTDSLSSQLDEIFDILEQCAPESLTYAAFMKRLVKYIVMYFVCMNTYIHCICV